MITKRGILASASALTLGGVLLVGGASAAYAEAEYGDEDVDVSVQIAPLVVPGVLTMTVSGSSTTLTEEGSNATVRQFTGTMPTVTVTDTRTADEIPDGAYWYVIGSASTFAGDAGQPGIGAEYLGWTPHLIDGGDSGLVAEGEQVDTALDSGDDNVGLVDTELLALALDSEAVATDGTWTANADLFLKTPSAVAPGNYTSTLTLSLFE